MDILGLWGRGALLLLASAAGPQNLSAAELCGPLKRARLVAAVSPIPAQGVFLTIRTPPRRPKRADFQGERAERMQAILHKHEQTGHFVRSSAILQKPTQRVAAVCNGARGLAASSVSRSTLEKENRWRSTSTTKLVSRSQRPGLRAHA